MGVLRFCQGLAGWATFAEAVRAISPWMTMV
jgi:hypothetical protein